MLFSIVDSIVPCLDELLTRTVFLHCSFELLLGILPCGFKFSPFLSGFLSIDVELQRNSYLD